MRILFAWLLLITPVLAQEAPPASTSVKLDGAVKTPATYTMAGACGAVLCQHYPDDPGP